MEVMLRAVFFILAILYQLLRPIYWYIFRDHAQRIPPITNPLLKMSAVALAKKIRQREVSSESVVEAFIERIKEVNPILNAVVEDRFEAALRDARICDKRLEAGEVSTMQLEFEQPLYGVPLTVKESCAVKGISWTGCSLACQGVKANYDSAILESLKNAGAIPLCVSNTPELCLGFEANNYAVGRTYNPYDGRHTAGGSSGGEGALLASAASVVGVGSDIAGSIRLPALFNGVFGHKPTSGIISNEGHFPNCDGVCFQKYLVLGPMARYAEDLSLMVRVMSGKNADGLRLDDSVDVKKLHVHYMEDAGESFGMIPTSDDIRRVIGKASSYLKERGANVNEESIEELKDSFEMGLAMYCQMDKFPELLHGGKNALIEAGKAIVGQSQYTTLSIILKLAIEVNCFIPRSRMPQYETNCHALREIFVKMLGSDGVFFYPTFVRTAPMHNQMTLQLAGTMYGYIFNILGLPSTHVPMGLDDNGLPIGFQVVAGPRQDRLCLAVARELERGFGGWVAPT